MPHPFSPSDENPRRCGALDGRFDCYRRESDPVHQGMVLMADNAPVAMVSDDGAELGEHLHTAMVASGVEPLPSEGPGQSTKPDFAATIARLQAFGAQVAATLNPPVPPPPPEPERNWAGRIVHKIGQLTWNMLYGVQDCFWAIKENIVQIVVVAAFTIWGTYWAVSLFYLVTDRMGY